MSAILQSDLWVEFFRNYRRLPALWKTTDEMYKNKRAKQAAYEKLLAHYKKIDPQANIDTMRRRMNGIRTCFRRELRKVELSEYTSKKASDVYVPHLWYYNELSFLRLDASEKKASYDAVDDSSDSFFNDDDEEMNELKQEIELEERNIESPLEEAQKSPSNNSCQDPIKASVNQTVDHSQNNTSKDALMPSVNQTLHNTAHQARDEANIYAEGWATSYRKLDERNKLLAKKAIEEILVLGQLNQLEFNSVKMPY
ncbi:hypothetical protein ACLKA6_016990 [Drosophila palustris]